MDTFLLLVHTIPILTRSTTNHTLCVLVFIKKKSKEVFLETETEHGNNGTNITGVLFFHYVESKKAINVFFSIN